MLNQDMKTLNFSYMECVTYCQTTSDILYLSNSFTTLGALTNLNKALLLFQSFNTQGCSIFFQNNILCVMHCLRIELYCERGLRIACLIH